MRKKLRPISDMPEYQKGLDAAKAMQPISEVEAMGISPISRNWWLQGWYAGGGNASLGIVETPLMVLERKRKDAVAVLAHIDKKIEELQPAEKLSTQHTPGPWYPHTQEIQGNIVVFISNGPGLFSEPAHAVAADFSPSLCGVCLKKEDGSLWPAEANARLIAASPSLYQYVTQRAEQGCHEALNILINHNIYDHAEESES